MIYSKWKLVVWVPLNPFNFPLFFFFWICLLEILTCHCIKFILWKNFVFPFIYKLSLLQLYLGMLQTSPKLSGLKCQSFHCLQFCNLAGLHWAAVLLLLLMVRWGLHLDGRLAGAELRCAFLLQEMSGPLIFQVASSCGLSYCFFSRIAGPFPW